MARETRNIPVLPKERPETDQGPYYHDAFWESDKGMKKGMFGGLVIGSVMGGGAGVAIAAGLALALGTAITGGLALGIVGGFAGLGALLGAHEFSQAGSVTGAVAAAHEISEKRMKEFTDSRFNALKREIAGLKAVLTGRPVAVAEVGAEADCAATDAKQDDYRMQHCDDNHCQVEQQFLFRPIAVAGAVVGAGAGALLGYSDMLHEFLQPLHHAGLSALASAPAGALVGGALGATFGVNRDYFRRVFDKTDSVFKKGFVVKEPEREKAPELTPVEARGLEAGQAQTFCAGDFIPDGRSATFFQDKRRKELEMKYLLEMEHTTMRPN